MTLARLHFISESEDSEDMWCCGNKLLGASGRESLRATVLKSHKKSCLYLDSVESDFGTSGLNKTQRCGGELVTNLCSARHKDVV